MNKSEWQKLLTEFIRGQFVADGMCANVAIHDTDGHNPHAHIMLTVRPLDEQGKWQYKTEKEYLCVRDGEERGFTAAEFKTAQADGWEKQYQYKVGRKKCTWLLLSPKLRDMFGHPSIRKAQNTEGRIPSPIAGTVTSSLSSGARHGLIFPISIWNQLVPMPGLTTAVMPSAVWTNSPPSTRV